MSLIGSNIKNIRLKKNISAKELSKKCGLSENALMDIESGRKIPNTNIINSISKALGVQIDAIEPAYFQDYFEEDNIPAKQPAVKNKAAEKDSQANSPIKDSSLSDAFNKAIRKIPVLSRITPGKSIPYESDIVDYKFEPVFQTKNNNISGDHFIYYVLPDNSMSGSRMLKNDIALVFMTDSIMDRDIVLLTYNNKAYVRRIKTSDKTVLLYPDNPDYEIIITNIKDIQIIGKIVRVEFKI
ncbi:MAG: helix-turn-helix domain-containing protein [Bacillota bacterium]